MSNEYKDWLRDEYDEAYAGFCYVTKILLRDCPKYEKALRKNFPYLMEKYDET